MARYDVEKLARDIVNIEKKHSALSLSTQLPNSSVRLSTGEEGDVAAGIEDGTDALVNNETLYDYADEIGDLNDEDIDYGATIPDWILNAGSVGDTAWDLANTANENVEEALENADQAAADALAAAQKAAEADKKATEAKGAAKEYLPNTNFSLGADGLDGWTVLDGTPATHEGGALMVGFSFDEDGQAVWHDYVEDVSIRGTGDYSVAPGSSIEFSTDFAVLSGGDSYLTMYIDVAVAGSYYVRTKEITISETNISTTRSMTWTNDDDEAAFVRVGYVIHVEPGVQYVIVNQATLKDVTGVVKAQEEAEAAKFLAEGIYQVIPSVTEPTQAPNGSELKQGDQWWVIGAEETEQAGKFVGVKVYDGTQWIDRQIVADSVLVPGSVGPVLIENGAITGQKISADAIDGKVINSVTIRGAELYGGKIQLETVEDQYAIYSEPFENTSSAYGWMTYSDYGFSWEEPPTLDDTEYRSPPYALKATMDPRDPYYKGMLSPTMNITMPSDGLFVFWFKPNVYTESVEVSGISGSIHIPGEYTPNEWHKITLPINKNQRIANILILSWPTDPETNISEFTFWIDDLEIIADVMKESYVSMERLPDGRAVFVSNNDRTGEQVMMSEGNLYQTYTDPLNINYGHSIAHTKEGIQVGGTHGTGYKIETNRGRGDSILLYTENLTLDALEIEAKGQFTTPGNSFTGRLGLDGLETWYNAPDGTRAWVKSTQREYIRRDGQWRVSDDDTGWLPVVFASGWRNHTSGEACQYRVKNGVVYFRGTIARTSGNIPTSGQHDMLGALPEVESRGGFAGDGYATTLLIGPTGGTLARVYPGGSGVKMGGSGNYGNGAATYLGITGMSGTWLVNNDF